MNVKVDECQGGQLVWWTYVGWMDVGLLSVGWMDVLEPLMVSTVTKTHASLNIQTILNQTGISNMKQETRHNHF